MTTGRDAVDLLEHDPRIAAVRALSPARGAERASVLVLPDPAWLAAEREAAAAATSRALRSWETSYDLAYRRGGDPDATPSAPDFAIWTDSVTRAPIPLAEMRDWLHHTTALLLALPHARVRELGCGTGLLVEAIAPRCRSYEASDLSAVGMARLRAWLATRPELAHVTTAIGAAHHPPASEAEVDLVVINSVVQHFPDRAYLETVLDAAWRGLAPGGHLVVGDVRLAALQPAFIAAAAVFRAPDGQDVGGLRRAIRAAWLAETELVIDPAFFHAFAHARGASAEIRLKPGRAANEMTRTRADAVLAKPAGPTRPAPVTAELPDLAALRVHLAARAPGPAVLRGLANARIARDIALRAAIRAAPDALPVASLTVEPAARPSIDPTDIIELCASHGVACTPIAPPHAADGRFDVWIGGHRETPDPERATEGGSPRPLTSDPLKLQGLRRLVAALHATLSDALPPEHLPERILPVLRACDLDPSGYETFAWMTGSE